MQLGARRKNLIERATGRVALAAALVVLIAGEALAQVAVRARTGSGAGSVSVQLGGGVGGAVGGGSVTHTVRGGGVWYGPTISGYGGTYRQVVYGRDGYPSAETGPYRYVTPWPRVINGVPAYAHGYPPHYGPRSRLSPGYRFWYWGPYSVYFANEFDTPVYETSRRVDPAIANAPANQSAAAAAAAASAVTVVEAPRDLGAEALRERDYGRAIAVYARRAQEQRDAEASAESSAITSGTVSADATSTLATGAARATSVDRTAQRLLAVAMVGDRRPAEAQAAMVAAYRDDAALAGTLAEEGLIDASEWRRITNVAVAHAHQARSEAAWLLVARLMEMQGRGAVAKTMFERAAATARGDSRPELIEGPKSTPNAAKTPEPAKKPGPASFRMPRP
jgi:hypothetical protein